MSVDHRPPRPPRPLMTLPPLGSPAVVRHRRRNTRMKSLCRKWKMSTKMPMSSPKKQHIRTSATGKLTSLMSIKCWLPQCSRIFTRNIGASQLG